MSVDYEKFWTELANEVAYPPQQPGEITVSEFAALIGISKVYAYRILEQETAKGNLIKRSRIGRPNYYRKANRDVGKEDLPL